MKIKTLCAFTLLFGTSFISAQTITRCGGPSTALYINWPLFHFDVCRTGNNPYEHILSSSTIGKLVPDWQVYGNDNDSSSAPDPVLVNGVVYAAIGNISSATLFAVDANTSKAMWQKAIGATSAPTVTNGMLYIGSWDGSHYHLNALNAGTGALVWQYPDELEVYSSPVVADGILYFGAYPSFYALDARTGALIWKSGVDSGGNSAAAVVNGIVYFNSYTNVDALNARTGALLWQMPAGMQIRGGPTVFNGVVYVNSNTGPNNASVFALNALSGTVIWESKLYDTFNGSASPAIANGVVYVGGASDVRAIDARTGSLLWTQGVNSASDETAPAVANGVVYVGSAGIQGYAEAYALDAGTGSVLWQYDGRFGIVLFSSPVVANGMLFLGSVDLEAQAGVLWAFHLPSQ